MSAPFDIGDEVRAAWESVSGTKQTIWIGVLWVIMIIAPIVFFSSVLTASVDSYVVRKLISVATNTLQIMIGIGVFLMGIDYARGQATSPSRIMSVFQAGIPLAIACFLTSLFTTIGYFLLFIPGLYLFISYLFALPLVCDKQLEPWEAMETSRKTVTEHWLTYFLANLVMNLIMMLSAIPLGIGLFWTIPMSVHLYGRLYVKTFDTGTELATPGSQPIHRKEALR